MSQSSVEPAFELDRFELVLLKRPTSSPTYSEEELEQLQARHMAHLLEQTRLGHIRVAGPVDEQRPYVEYVFIKLVLCNRPANWPQAIRQLWPDAWNWTSCISTVLKAASSLSTSQGGVRTANYRPSSRIVHASIDSMTSLVSLHGSFDNVERIASSDSALTAWTTRTSSHSGPPRTRKPLSTNSSMNAACSVHCCCPSIGNDVSHSGPRRDITTRNIATSSSYESEFHV